MSGEPIDLDAIEADLAAYKNAFNAPASTSPYQWGLIVGQAAVGVCESVPALVAEVRRLRQSLDRVRELHNPVGDGPLSLVSSPYCSCGAYESFIAGDGHRSIGPAGWPCATVRAITGEG